MVLWQVKPNSPVCINVKHPQLVVKWKNVVLGTVKSSTMLVSESIINNRTSLSSKEDK